MKKFAITMMAILAMFAGAACSGSTSSPTTKVGGSNSTTTGWSDANKARLSIKIVEMSGKEHLFTQSQQGCIFDWITSHYKTMDEMEADTTSSPDALLSACVK